MQSEKINTINIFENLTKKQSFTVEETRQASLFKDYLVSSGANKELESFLDKALKNKMADEFKEYQEKQSEQDFKDRTRALIYF